MRDRFLGSDWLDMQTPITYGELRRRYVITFDREGVCVCVCVCVCMCVRVCRSGRGKTGSYTVYSLSLVTKLMMRAAGLTGLELLNKSIAGKEWTSADHMAKETSEHGDSYFGGLYIGASVTPL